MILLPRLRFLTAAILLPLLSLGPLPQARAQLAQAAAELAERAIESLAEDAAKKGAQDTAEAAAHGIHAPAKAMPDAAAPALRAHALAALAAGATLLPPTTPYLSLGSDGLWHLLTQQADNTFVDVTAQATQGGTGASVHLADGASVIVERDSLVAAAAQLAPLSQHVRLWSVVDDGAPREVHVRRTPAGWVPTADMGGGLELALDGRPLSEIAQRMRAAIDLSTLQVWSLFDASDADVVDRLAAALGDRHRPWKGGDARTLVDAMFATRGQQRIVVGHVEGGDLVIRDARDAVVARVPVASLEAGAKASGSTLLVLGCGTGGIAQGGGPLEKITDVWLAARLKAALATTTAGDFMAALADADNPLLLQSATLDGLAVHLRAVPLATRAGATAGQLVFTGIGGSLAQDAGALAQAGLRSAPGLPGLVRTTSAGVSHVVPLMIIGLLVGGPSLRTRWRASDAANGVGALRRPWLAIAGACFVLAFPLLLGVAGVVLLLHLAWCRPRLGWQRMTAMLRRGGAAAERILLRLQAWGDGRPAQWRAAAMGVAPLLLVAVAVVPMCWLMGRGG